MSMPFSFRFDREILNQSRARNLIQPGDRVLVAVSGGPDSVALLTWLDACRSLVQKLTLGVVHINHGLREDEADQDADFVEEMCRDLAFPCFQRKVPVGALYDGQKGLSLQAVAHRERYRVFVEVAEKFYATKVALGHTQDDQAETVIMWMLRGAGATGLAGMSFHRLPYFIRPFLGVSRTRILQYLRYKNISYRLDSSNAKPSYLRNRIRQELVPVLKQFNPNILAVLSRQSAILRDETQYLEQVADRACETVRLADDGPGMAVNRLEFLGLPPPIQRRVVMKILRVLGARDRNPSYDVVESLLDLVTRGVSGSLLCYKGMAVVRDYDRIRFVPRSDDFFSDMTCQDIPFTVPGSALWPGTTQQFEAEFVSLRTNVRAPGPFLAYFDGDRFSHSLTIRSWKPGDFFFPFGLHGQRKKVQDFFSDIKLSRLKRSRVPLMVAPEGILWVCGYRSDHRFRITEATKRIMSVKISDVGGTSEPGVE